MATYEKIMALAKNVPELCNFQGEVVDAKFYRALGIKPRTFMNWKKDDFGYINRPEIDSILKLLNCKYEDIFVNEKV
jgi:hypothetical protein